VEGDLHDRPGDLADQLMACPLLSEDSVWKQVDHAIIALGGSRSLGLSDVQEMVEALKDRLPANLPLVASASLDEEDHDKVRLTLLLAMTAPVAASAEKQPVAEKPAEGKTAAREPREPEPAAMESAPKPAKEPAKKIVRPAPVPLLIESPIEEISPAPAVAQASGQAPVRFIAKQEEMQFEGPPRGRFEKAHETIYNGENLDIPTFRRRRLVIRL
jgi:cell division protein FtsZ